MKKNDELVRCKACIEPFRLGQFVRDIAPWQSACGAIAVS